MRQDAKKVTALKVVELAPGKASYSIYVNTSPTMETMWKDIQTLFHAEKYVASLECTALLMKKAKKERKNELYKRCLLIRARLYVVLGDTRASDAYKEVIAHEYSELFVYTSPYSYNMELFKRAESMPVSSMYLFVFSEYLINVKRSKTKERQEYLFYRLITLHIHHGNPWDSHESNINLSLLPVHIREPYTKYTTDVLYSKEYEYQREREVKSRNTIANIRNARYSNNFQSIYGIK